MNGRKLAGLLFLCVVGLALWAGYISLQTDESYDVSATRQHTGVVEDVAAMQIDTSVSEPTSSKLPFTLPKSLQGTEIDGGFRVDEHGHLIIDKSIKRFMDYFLGTVGELSVEEIVANLETLVQGALAEPARSEAMTILRNYIDYKQGLVQLEQDIGEVNVLTLDAGQLGGMAERLRIIRETRVAFLGEDVANAFFGEEEAVDQYTLKKLQIVNNQELNETQKKEQLQSAEAMLPAHIKQQREQTQMYEQLSVREYELKSSGASAAEVYAARAEMVGDEAAQRLALLDAERADFTRRLRAYRLEKKALDETAMDEVDKSAALDRLRQSHFTELEIRRVVALDRIGRE